MKSTVLPFAVLLAFWLIITENLYWDSIVTGVVVCLVVVRFNRDIMVNTSDLPALNLRRARILLAHFGQMLVEVIKANVQVVRIVLSRNMEFEQGLVIFSPKLSHEWIEVLFANSITLTPGTLTLDLEDDVYTVHILDMGNADSLVSWSIRENLERLEDEGL